MMDFIKQILSHILIPIHKEGHVFIFIFAATTLILSLFSSTLGWVGGFATLWCIYFFRNPARIIPQRDGLILSPADGVIQKIEQAKLPSELGSSKESYNRISIFLNVFNVHVNRIPIEGVVKKVEYVAGKFLNASLDKASEDNERNCLLISAKNGKSIACVQIAGLIARRIVCDVKDGDEVKTGQRFGIIRFGSRVDIYLPNDVNPLVIEGQQAIAGETIIADLNSNESQRTGVRD